MRRVVVTALLALCGIVYGQDCTFDGRLTDNPRCGWSNDYEDDFDWSINRFPTLTPFTGPTGDHTTGSGNFLYTETNGKSAGDKARLYSPVDTPGNSDGTITVLTFWYSMWDIFPLGVEIPPIPGLPDIPIPETNMGTLNVYLEYRGKVPTGEPVWSRSGKQTDRSGWKEAKIMFRAPSSFRIIFEGVIGGGNGDRSDMGIDDVKVLQTEIPSTCDFESSPLGDLCIFNQEDLTDDFDWTRQAGETPSLDTGPLTDQTYMNETGHYLYIETTRPNVADNAVLRSFPYFKNDGRCVVGFYYHAFGVNVGTLQVEIDHETTSTTLVVGGQSNDTWIYSTISIISTEGYYTIVFEGTRGDGNLGDIAIDDITLSDGCIAIDYCSSYPCQNQGTCRSGQTGFECDCVEGWTGTSCDENVDDCTPDRCPEGYVCEDLINDVKCYCPDGQQGDNCEEEIPTEAPIEPIDTHPKGVDPEMIPVIIGSCIGSFILIVTATWFTATCIRQDKFRKKEIALEAGEKGSDGDGGPASDNAYVNTTYDDDSDDDAKVADEDEQGTSKEKSEDDDDKIRDENENGNSKEKAEVKEVDKKVSEDLSTKNDEAEEAGGSGDKKSEGGVVHTTSL